MDRGLLEELKKSFVFNQERERDDFWIDIEPDAVYGNLNVLFFEHHFERLIFLDYYSDVERDYLILLLEHRDYPIRIFVKVFIDDVLIPFLSFHRWWKNASYFERRVNSETKKEIFTWKDQPLCVRPYDDSEENSHQSFIPPNDLWGGDGALDYQVKDGVLSQIFFKLGLQDRRVELYFHERVKELFPILIKQNFSKWQNTLIILLYKSIEDLLEVEVDPVEVSYRMTLLELDRLKEILRVFNNVFDEQSLVVLKNLISELQDELDELLLENSSEHFGFIYPRKIGNKFSSYWLQRVDRLLQKTLIAQNKIARSLRNNAFFLHPLSEIKLPNISYLNQLDGHLLKANGGTRDLRIHYPYYFYEQLELDVPVGQSFSVADFYFVLQKELDIVMSNLNLLIAGVPVGTLESKEKKYLFDKFEEFLQNDQSKDGLLSYTSFDSFQGELGIGCYKKGKEIELRFYRPGSICMVYLLDLFKGIPTENISTLLPYMGIDLKELEL